MTEETKEKLLAAANEDTLQSKDYPISTQDAFVHGVNKYLEMIWHSAEEEPSPGREIILRTSKGMKVHPNTTKSQMAWSYFIRITRAENWAYSEDFLPESLVPIESK